jgi:hypothetical protein
MLSIWLLLVVVAVGPAMRATEAVAEEQAVFARAPLLQHQMLIQQ